MLVLPLAAPLLWLAHDWFLTGDPLFAVRVPGRYSDIVSGRQVVPADWLAVVARRYAADPLLLALAAVGTVWLWRRRAWVWLAGLGAAGLGVLTLLGLQAWQGTYISWRYFDPADLALRLAAALGAAALATWAAGRLRRGAAAWPSWRPGCWPGRRAGRWSRPTRWSTRPWTGTRACRPTPPPPSTPSARWPPSPGPSWSSRAAAAPGRGRARPAPGPGPRPVPGRPDRPLDRALAGDAVFHDADGDRPRTVRPALTTTPVRVGEVELVPLRTDPGAVRPPGGGHGESLKRDAKAVAEGACGFELRLQRRLRGRDSNSQPSP